MQRALHPVFETSERLILKRQEKQPKVMQKLQRKSLIKKMKSS